MSIRLSEKYGLNPSIALCFACGKEKNEIVIPGRLKGDTEAPRMAVWNKNPCDDCKSKIAEGYVICMEVVNGTENDPVRTGEILYIKKHAFEQIFNITPVPSICYLEQEVCEKIRRKYEFNR